MCACVHSDRNRVDILHRLGRPGNELALRYAVRAGAGGAQSSKVI